MVSVRLILEHELDKKTTHTQEADEWLFRELPAEATSKHFCQVAATAPFHLPLAHLHFYTSLPAAGSKLSPTF